MADYVTEGWAGVRAALLSDAGVAALVADRVVDHADPDILLPYVQLGRVEPVRDDTDGTTGAQVTMGLICHSRPPYGGQTEANLICEAISDALHRQPEAVTVTGLVVMDVQVLTWAVTRRGDGVTYEARLALDLMLQG